MSDTEKCEHVNFDEYFERCEDCGLELVNFPKEMQKAYKEQFDK